MIRAQQLRIDAGLSVAQLSEITGVNRATIARLERTERAGHFDALAKIAGHFDVAPDHLLLPVGPIDASEAAA